ncbi:MAG: hypothetical protein ACU0CA_07435 [Paracoccaceae bacterium]
MSLAPFKSIVVIDVGSTNTKIVQYDATLRELRSKSEAVDLVKGAPYLSLDAGRVMTFALNVIAEFDAIQPVDVIVPCAHGSALALMDGRGELALPIMSYQAKMPTDIAETYSKVEPPFDEVLSPTNPGALTLARQLLWQETKFPVQFEKVRQIVPYAQYIAFLLTGVAANEMTALGAQTHLWAPARQSFSQLAEKRGWARLFAPMRPAHQALGRIKGTNLLGQGHVLTGVHDSNANYFRYSAFHPFVLLSTGTWIIAFDGAAPLDKLKGERDQVSNTTVSGKPVACCRFMGGQEFADLAGDARLLDASLADAARLIDRGTIALPSFTDSGGPVPGSGGQGRFIGPHPVNDREWFALASLYTAQMTTLAIDALGSTQHVIVDGPFSRNPIYMSVLAALLPQRLLFASMLTNGTASGAAMLAFGATGSAPVPHAEITAVEAADLGGLREYHNQWLARVADIDAAFVQRVLSNSN